MCVYVHISPPRLWKCSSCVWTWSCLSPPRQCAAICDCPGTPALHMDSPKALLGLKCVAWENETDHYSCSTETETERDGEREMLTFLPPPPPRLLWTALAPRGFWQLLPVRPFDWWGPSQMFPSPNQWEFKCFVHVNSRHNITGSGPCRSLAASLLISPLNVSKAPHESGPTQRQPMEMEGSPSFASSSSILSRMLLLNSAVLFH